MLQEREQVLHIALADELEGPRLHGFGQLIQQGLCRALAERFFQNRPGVFHTAVGHHLLREAGLVKFIQDRLHLLRAHMSQLGNLYGQLLYI